MQPPAGGDYRFVHERTIAFLTLAMFCLQLLRVFYVVPGLNYICLVDQGPHATGEHHHDSGEFVTGHHHDGPDHDEPASIQHCKDPLDGIAIISSAALLHHGAQPVQVPPAVWTHLPRYEQSVIENVLPRPYHPPRAIA